MCIFFLKGGKTTQGSTSPSKREIKFSVEAKILQEFHVYIFDTFHAKVCPKISLHQVTTNTPSFGKVWNYTCDTAWTKTDERHLFAHWNGL